MSTVWFRVESLIMLAGLVKAFTGDAVVQGSRSTVLNTLIWMAGALFLSIIVSSVYGVQEWILILFSIFLSINACLFFGFFIYFALTDKDALRSESFGIQKMQLQQGIMGDDVGGFNKQIEGNSTPNPNVFVGE